MNRFAIFVLAGLLTIPVAGAPKNAQTDGAHVTAIKEWRAKRVERLRSPDGWLTLIGLHWLDNGSTSFGSARTNPILLPTGPAVAGSFEVQEENVFLVPSAGVTVDGKPARRMRLISDAGGKPTIVNVGSVSMQLIERSGRVAVRIKDPNATARTSFAGLDYFPITESNRVEAVFIPYTPEKKLKIANVVGMTEEMVSPGALQFRMGGKTYRLDPVIEAGSDEYFVIFADRTNGKSTYGAGRYVYVAKPDARGRTVIDFNKAYNPPCAFTAYATCPLPPRQNRLAVAIEAGEKTYGKH